MNKLSILGIIASGVLVWWVSGYAERQANRLEQEGTGAGRSLPPPARIVDGMREFDDIPPNPLVLEGDILVPVDPVEKEQLRQAAIYRNVSNATKGKWWVLPLGLTVVLLVRKAKRFFLRFPGETGICVGGHHDAKTGELHGLIFQLDAEEPNLVWDEKCPECIAYRDSWAGREGDPFAATRGDQQMASSPDTPHAITAPDVQSPETGTEVQDEKPKPNP